jgi:hypothetical protein
VVLAALPTGCTTPLALPAAREGDLPYLLAEEHSAAVVDRALADVDRATSQAIAPGLSRAPDTTYTSAGHLP